MISPKYVLILFYLILKTVTLYLTITNQNVVIFSYCLEKKKNFSSKTKQDVYFLILNLLSLKRHLEKKLLHITKHFQMCLFEAKLQYKTHCLQKKRSNQLAKVNVFSIY